MKIKIFIFTFIVSFSISYATIANESGGVITKKSDYTVTETLNRLEKILKKKGVTIFARINHSKNAKNVGIELLPTELLVFGNPKLGTHFFTSNQLSAIDLPMKVLSWQDKNGKVWLAYNEPTYIANRHNINNRSEVITKMTKTLNILTNNATTK